MSHHTQVHPFSSTTSLLHRIKQGGRQCLVFRFGICSWRTGKKYNSTTDCNPLRRDRVATSKSERIATLVGDRAEEAYDYLDQA